MVHSWNDGLRNTENKSYQQLLVIVHGACLNDVKNGVCI